ncbi:MAG: NgoBV family restriction endonuclease [Christensenellaceae bacterium]|jgi:type II restriction enzyme|nr:NgoBV family restriction endonuclease [Christensenellaceae bacterium]
MPYGIKAQQLFDKLKAKHIIGARGKISLELLDLSIDINDKSATGNLLQEWLGAWMRHNNIYFRIDANTQVFPDFYLSDDNTTDLLEVKTFDYSKSPNFDVAPFDAYVDSLKTKQYRLDADYLILGYILKNGVLIIKDIWLKKIWEITCPAQELPLRVQRKRGKIYNIRPYNFKSHSLGFQPFATKEYFVNAIKRTLQQYPMRTEDPESWFREVASSYNSSL